MKYVALDVGNVLVHADFTDFIKKLSKEFNLTMTEALYFMNRNQKLHDLGLTRMRDELGDHFKVRSEVLLDELVADWNRVIEPNLEILDLLCTMKRENGLKIALLSNVGTEHLVRMKQVLNYSNFMDGNVTHFSCEVGARKPQMVYYHTFLQLHPGFEGCPYIDDVQENLDMGAQFGFKPYKFALDSFQSPPGVTLTHLPTIEAIQAPGKLRQFILDSNKPRKNPRWH